MKSRKTIALPSDLVDKLRVNLCELAAKASARDPRLSFEDVDICCDLRGRAAGHALVMRDHRHLIRLNVQACMENLDWVVNEILPHELAHVICHKENMRANHQKKLRAHGPRWRAWCRFLGASGATTHAMPLESVRKSTKYLYRLPSGEEVKVSSIRHRRMQHKGYAYLMKNGASLTRDHWVAEDDS